MNKISKIGFIECFIIGLVLSGIYWFTIFDNGQSIKNLIDIERKKYSELVIELKKASETLGSSEQYESKVREFKFLIGKLEKSFPESTNSADMLRILAQTASDSGLDIGSLRPDQESRIAGEPYAKVPVSLDVKGSFFEIMQFLSKITIADKVITVDKFSMRSISSVKGKKEKIGMKVVVVGYRYIPEGEKEEEKEGDKK